MSARNFGSSDKALFVLLNDMKERIRRLERRRPVVDEGSGGGETICDCEDGVGVPVGGTTGQVLAKNSATDFDTEWVDAGGGGAVVCSDCDLNDLGDVQTDSAAEGHTLFYTTADGGFWYSGSPADVPSSIDDLADVDTSSDEPNTGDLLEWDGTNWVPAPPGSIGDLSDVDITGAADGDHLVRTSGIWNATTPSTAVTIPDAGSSLPAIGTEGSLVRYKHVLFEDNGLYWWPIGGRMEQIAVEFTHFFNNNAQKVDFQSLVNGTNATIGVGTVAAGTQGIAQLDTGTTTTGRASYAAGQASALRGTADKEMLFITRVRFPNLATVAEDYYFQVGFISSLTATSPDGFYFRYNRSVSANWYAVVVNNSTGTAGVDTGTAVASNAFQKLRIEVDEPGVSADFYIDGVLEATITTNFPGSTRDFGPAINIRKTAGTTARVCDADYVGYWSLVTTTV